MSREDEIKNLKETFTYDKLNRLKSSQVTGQDVINLLYNKNSGNIFSKSDVGGDDYTYKYGESGAGVHAVTFISEGTTSALETPLPHDCIVWYKSSFIIP